MITLSPTLLETIGVAFFIYGLAVLTLQLLGFFVTRLERWWTRRHPD